MQINSTGSGPQGPGHNFKLNYSKSKPQAASSKRQATSAKQQAAEGRAQPQVELKMNR